MTGSTLGSGSGSVLGTSTAVVLPATGILPKTGSGLLLTLAISAFVAIVASLTISKLAQKLS